MCVKEGWRTKRAAGRDLAKLVHAVKHGAILADID